MMTVEKLDKWWGHLPVVKKEAIAREPYPECSQWWCDLSEYDKYLEYKKAGGLYAHKHHQWKKGNGSFTD